MPTHIDAYSDGHLSEYSYSESLDTIDEILKRFTLDYRPEYVVKLRDRRGNLIIGADVGYDSDTKSGSLAVLMKPVDRASWWRRIKVQNDGEVSVRSRKLNWWIFTLDLQGEINPIKNTRDLSFRLATTWDVSSGRYENKKKLKMMDGVEGRMSWNVNYNLPELSGRFSSKNENKRTDMHAELGYAHAEISRVELAVWPREIKYRKPKLSIGHHTSTDDSQDTEKTTKDHPLSTIWNYISSSFDG